MLGGVLFVTWGYLHGNVAYASSGRMVAAAMGFLVDALLLAGFLGLCAWWWEGPRGWLGTVGCAIGCAGAVLGVAHGIHSFVSASGIAEPAPWYVYVREFTGLPAKVFRWLPLLPVGLVTVGISSIRNGGLGGRGLLPLAVGAFGGAYQLTDSGGVLEMGSAHVVFGAGCGVGWVALGCLLWPTGNERNARASRGS